MTDLIQRLRDGTFFGLDALMIQAADALKSQAAEIALHVRNCAELGAEAIRLQSEVQALRADAERYRWLRDNGHEAIGRDRGAGPEWTYGDELDALIDAARAAMQTGGP